jgi:hypothetical protein
MPGSHARALQKNAKPQEDHKTAGCPKKTSGLRLRLPAMSAASGVKSDGNSGLTSEDEEYELYGKQGLDDDELDDAAVAHKPSQKRKQKKLSNDKSRGRFIILFESMHVC